MSTPSDLPRPKTRQELYDQIRETSFEETILAEMIRYGFWPKAGSMPEDPADEIRRMGELERELTSLKRKLGSLHDLEKLTREARKQRMLDSRQRQKENRERRIRERLERAEAWKIRKTKEILYLGDEGSPHLNNHDADTARLKAQGLPHFADPAALAKDMEITVGTLRFLSYSRKVSHIHHYQRYTIPKKTGGERLISAPMKRLKAAQHWILEHILAKVETHDCAHGFVNGRSIVSNAQPHVGANTVVNVDLENFFPTITYPRVWGCFRALGYAPSIATILALLCTESEVSAVELDGKTWYVRRSARFLPQGAPTSPAITNIICRRLDKRLYGLSKAHDFTYTRYADDLTFSSTKKGADTGSLLNKLRYIIRHEGFAIHPKKTRVLHKGRRQEVTGLVVNEKLSIERRELKRFRATLFQIEKDGPKGKRWGHSPNLFDSIEGYANFVYMVDPAKGTPLVEKVKTLRKKYKA